MYLSTCCSCVITLLSCWTGSILKAYDRYVFAYNGYGFASLCVIDVKPVAHACSLPADFAQW